MARKLAGALLALALPAAADQVILTDGDRITGTVVAKGTRRVRLQTPYGLLVIPRERIERIRKDDGTEEVFVAPAAAPVAGDAAPPAPATTRAPSPSRRSPVRLVLLVTGHSFWQAWDPKAAPADPSLRLEVQLDGKTVGAYRDPILDPEDLPKATVNTFVFLPDSVAREGAPGVSLLPPEAEPGRIRLILELPPSRAGTRTLRLAYQANQGPYEDPRWTDLAEATLELRLGPGQPATVRLEQDRGAMEFVKKRMRGIETFVMTVRAGLS